MTRMLVTRPEPDAQATVMRLRALDIEATAVPLLKRVMLETELPPAEAFSALALTSANALRALSERGVVEAYRHLPVYAVGSRTAFEAEALGFARVHDAGGALGDLVNLMVHGEITGTVFHPAGRHLSGDLKRSVGAHGISVETVPVYDMEPVADLPEAVLGGLDGQEFSAALFYSRRTAASFVSALGERLTRGLREGLEMLCISESAAEPLVAAHFTRISLADRPDDSAMMTLALAFAREQNGA